jgi:hypothetical protein
MKTSTFFCSLLLFVLIMTKCSSNNEEKISEGVNFEYELIGVEHNKGLDYVFEKLKKENADKGTTLRSSSDLSFLIKKASINFTLESEFGKGLEYNQMEGFLNSFGEIELRSGNTKNSGGIISVLGKVELTPLQIHYINQLDDILSKYEHGDIQSTIEYIKNFEAEIIKTGSPDDLQILLSTTSVARYSLQYWLENHDKWMSDIFDNSSVEQRISLRCSEDDDWEWFCETIISMAESDAIGAAIGAGVGALAGGVGAAPGAVVGACNASAGAGIKCLFQKWGIF